MLTFQFRFYISTTIFLPETTEVTGVVGMPEMVGSPGVIEAPRHLEATEILKASELIKHLKLQWLAWRLL